MSEEERERERNGVNRGDGVRRWRWEDGMGRHNERDCQSCAKNGTRVRTLFCVSIRWRIRCRHDDDETLKRSSLPTEVSDQRDTMRSVS